MVGAGGVEMQEGGVRGGAELARKALLAAGGRLRLAGGGLRGCRRGGAVLVNFVRRCCLGRGAGVRPRLRCLGVRGERCEGTGAGGAWVSASGGRRGVRRRQG